MDTKPASTGFLSLHRHFAASDAEKFMKVWLMNEEEAKGLMRKALDADRIIHTQQLGLPWEEPHYWFLNNIGPFRHYKAKRVATKLAAEVLTGGTHSLSALVTPVALGNPHLHESPAASPVFAIAKGSDQLCEFSQGLTRAQL